LSLVWQVARVVELALCLLGCGEAMHGPKLHILAPPGERLAMRQHKEKVRIRHLGWVEFSSLFYLVYYTGLEWVGA
jgi:hypothetical protein